MTIMTNSSGQAKYKLRLAIGFQFIDELNTSLFIIISAPVSITENTSIDEFLSNAEAAQRSFEVIFYSFKSRFV